MFDASSDQELYELWINVPSFCKLQAPDVCLLGDSECPFVVIDNNKKNKASESETVVLAGSYQGQSSQAPIMSDMSIFHVRIQPGGGNNNNNSWTYSIPPSFETAVLYVQQVSLDIAGTTVPVHHTAYLETGVVVGSGTSTSSSDLLVVTPTNQNGGVDFLFLASRPLNEPVAAQGSMVMNDANEINQAYRDYQLGYMGQPWDQSVSWSVGQLVSWSVGQSVSRSVYTRDLPTQDTFLHKRHSYTRDIPTLTLPARYKAPTLSPYEFSVL